MDNLSQVLEKIKVLRVKKGKSQTQMAELLGITQAGYANIESNIKGKLSLAYAVGIAKALEVGFNELYNIDGDSQKIDSLNNEIETLKNRIKELEEQLEDKRRIVSLLENDDILSQIALTIRSIIEPYEPRKRDFNDLDSIIRELEEKQPYDRDSRESTRRYIFDNLDVLKKDKIDPPRLSNFSD